MGWNVQGESGKSANLTICPCPLTRHSQAGDSGFEDLDQAASALLAFVKTFASKASLTSGTEITLANLSNGRAVARLLHYFDREGFPIPAELKDDAAADGTSPVPLVRCYVWTRRGEACSHPLSQLPALHRFSPHESFR